METFYFFRISLLVINKVIPSAKEKRLMIAVSILNPSPNIRRIGTILKKIKSMPIFLKNIFIHL
ncbi:MAG: hypothetical protein HYT28_01655 [Parcubacteria group bacterium]|nr:hypothetical protein [Parcubacteria group bacterium]